MSSLPPEIRAMGRFSPVEDVVLPLLRERLDPIPVQTLVSAEQTFPFVLVRREPDWGYWGGDPRFIDSCTLAVNTFCEGIEADSDAANLAEAVRVALLDCVNVSVPGRGHLTRAQMVNAPRRAPDWATSTGPVQYADLPTAITRYETTFHLAIRTSR